MIEMDYTSAITYNKSKYFDNGKITKYELNFYSVSSYKDKEYRYVVDSFANRAHTNLTNLKSDMRQFLKVDGESLLVILILKTHSQCSFLYILRIILIPQSEKDGYRRIVESGRFYEFFMEPLGIDYLKESD